MSRTWPKHISQVNEEVTELRLNFKIYHLELPRIWKGLQFYPSSKLTYSLLVSWSWVRSKEPFYSWHTKKCDLHVCFRCSSPMGVTWSGLKIVHMQEVWDTAKELQDQGNSIYFGINCKQTCVYFALNYYTGQWFKILLNMALCTNTICFKSIL